MPTVGQHRSYNLAVDERMQGDPWESVRALDRVLVPPADVPPEARPVLASLADLRQRLTRDARTIGFFGAYNAGKSTLLNALLGWYVLPAHARLRTRLPTVLAYAEMPRVEVWQGEIARDVPVGELRDILLAAGKNADEVRVYLPAPLLASGWQLMDTPPADDEAVSDISPDLAVLVLAADKILSMEERDLAWQFHDLLHGNVIHVVNRIDLVPEDEREDVMAWAADALAGSGNALLGYGQVLATNARDAQDPGVAALRDLLTAIVATPLGERLAVLSRLGAAEHEIMLVLAQLRLMLAAARARTEDVRAEVTRDLGQEREQVCRAIETGRSRLNIWKDALRPLEDDFVARCVEDTLAALRAAERPETVRLQVEAALHGYQRAVSEEIAVLLAGLPVTSPPFDLADWIVRTEVEAVRHPTSEIGSAFGELLTRVVDGGKIGRDVGATVGGWVGKRLFGVDVERETRRKVEGAARALLPSLEREVARHLEQIDALLAEAIRFYQGWTRADPHLSAAEEEESAWRRLADWCEGVLEVVRAIATAAG